MKLRVGDTGTGIPPEIAERVFEPFFTTKPKGKGTGLGLATVYGIITQTGGTAEIQSSPGAGTAFSAYLPATGKELSAKFCERYPGVRVLYMSGYAQPVLASQGTLDPGVILVEKPFSEDVLLDRVRAALDGP
ncbi:ATP-binding protein [Dactylosporangium aurantiacum]|uniref:ATP-binding protein n=1 Tax=Dactylosporangium aurantiacum TaxID=35754 RepID=UPI000694E190|nr:ATP-binding protein [Dactylosporangium aurantiacum]MDG6105925.1 ATP-binding protein [Dactylosporangium aurantiacum]